MSNPFEIIDNRLSNIEALLLSIKHQTPETASSLNPYKNTKLAADFLGKTPNALRVMVHKDQIKSIKKGNSLYFLETDLVEYLESGRRKTKTDLSDDCEDGLINKGGSQ